eukprot:gnl/Spiro4/12220_TR6447_c0_g1_i1.p1 gnl/Spiro4/12220_TR6447_c0_g1~~gnl/Spiro4/12220_TR6447_c0_g1_i1.p1  ORF type:complete len:223 (-),score=42.32 gnl/Spiro4/12220_TR6447_c0_g1_i1:19-639(-)
MEASPVWLQAQRDELEFLGSGHSNLAMERDVTKPQEPLDDNLHAVDPDYEMLQCPRERADELTTVLAEAYPTGGDGTPWTVEKTTAALLANECVPATYVVLFRPTNQIVATASVLRIPRESGTPGAPSGFYVHWVACLEAHRGKGLGRAVVSRVLKHIHSLGPDRILLLTQEFRVPAIRMYRNSLGFEPCHLDESHSARWGALLAA